MSKEFSTTPLELLDQLDVLLSAMALAPQSALTASRTAGQLATLSHPHMGLTLQSLGAHSTRLRSAVQAAEGVLKQTTKALQDVEKTLVALEASPPVARTVAETEKILKAIQATRKALRRSTRAVSGNPARNLAASTKWHMAWKIKIV